MFENQEENPIALAFCVFGMAFVFYLLLLIF